jgi:hypothetical protein
MRKRLITPTIESIRTLGEGWLDVERAAVVEVRTEDKDFPVESAFVSGDARGWRAAAPGSQTIRLIFDQPQKLRCICLVFEENETGRTQEFVLRSSGWRELAERHCCANSGISVHLNRHAKSKSIKWSFPTLLCSNWSSSRISVAESLARR